jgi:site-specific DNA recombinase
MPVAKPKGPPMTKQSNRTAAIYARFSSDLQKDRSISDQFGDLERYAQREGFRIVAKFSDSAKSGSTLFGRDGALELMIAAKARKFDVVIVESLSRLARDPEDIAGMFKRLNHAEVELHTLSDGIADNMKVGLRGIIDSEYLKNLATTIKRSQGARLREGLMPGVVTYGYDQVPGKPGERVVNEDKAKIIRRIFAEYAGKKSPRKIAADLTRDGIPSPSGGKQWNYQNLATGGSKTGILGNRIYIGELVWNRAYTVIDPDNGTQIRRARPVSEHIIRQVPHLRIIDDSLWSLVQDLRAARAAKFGPDGKVQRRAVIARSEHLLAGLLRCGECHGHMIVCKHSRGKRSVVCSSAYQTSACGHSKTYLIDALQATVLDGMRQRLVDPRAITEAARAFHVEHADQVRKDSAERGAVEKRRNKLVIQIDRIVSAIADSDEPLPALLASMKAKENERAGLEERLRLLSSSNVVSLHPNVIEDYKANVERLYEAISSEPEHPGNRVAFHSMIDSIVVHPTPAKAPYDVSVYGRLSAIMGVDLFPTARSNKEILAAEGVSCVDNGHLGCPWVSQSLQHVVCLGRWRAAA